MDWNQEGSWRSGRSCRDRPAEANDQFESSPFASGPVIIKRIQDLREELRGIQQDREFEAWMRERDRELGLE